MASTYSDRLRLELIANGEKNGTWGETTNVNLGTLLEEAISGYVSVSLSDADYTLTTQNGGTDEARNAVVRFTGTLTNTRDITIPTKEKVYIMRNDTSGGFALRVKVSGGTTYVYVPNGQAVLFYCDGANPKPGPTAIQGKLVISDSTDPTKRVTVDVSGITTGTTHALTLPDGPGAILVDSATQNISGKTMTGDFAAGGYKMTGLGDGSAAGDSAALSQVQSGLVSWGVAAGTVDAITLAVTPIVVQNAASSGMMLRFRATGANATTTPTLTVGSNDPLVITRYTGVALAAGDIPGAGYECLVMYNHTDLKWVLLNPYIQRAATTDVLTGTDANKAVTADALAAMWEDGGNLASANDLVVGEGGVFTITGTTQINTITLTPTSRNGRFFWFRFTTALTIRDNQDDIYLPGAANITTASGDVACFLQISAAKFKCVAYFKNNGKAVVETNTAVPAWVYVETVDLSSSTATSNLSAYRAVRLTLTNVRPSTDGQVLRARLATNADDGTSLTTGYEGAITTYSTTVSGSVAAPGNGELTATGIGNLVGDGTLSGVITFTNFNVARPTGIFADLTWGDTGGAFNSCNTHMWQTTAEVMGKIRISFSGSTATGNMVVEGQV